MAARSLLVLVPSVAVLLAATPPHPKPTTKATPTFANDVAPILYQRCVNCHSDSKVAPFSLVGYANAREHAKMVALVTGEKLMPPWKANLHYGTFKDMPVLTDEQISTLKSWADAGAPEGNPSEEPSPPAITPGWRLGPPDLVVTPTKPTKIPAEGGDFYRDYLIDPRITKPTWVRAIDFRPSGKNTVHHVIPAVITKEDAAKLAKVKFDHKDDDSWDQKVMAVLSDSNVLGMWSTGAPPFETPAGTAFQIKPGEQIVLDMHYKTTGKPELERTEVGLYFLKESPKAEMTVSSVESGDIYLQPGQPDWRVYAIGPPLRKATTVYAVWPHMHYLGRTFKAWARYPAGYSKPLVCINDWDPEWQLIYYLAKPMILPAGSKVYITGTYDNTTNNPRNPNSTPKVVESGPSSKDEMLLFDMYVVEQKPPVKPASKSGL